MKEDPGTKEVGQLLKEVDIGSYVIPHFQRGFEWSPGLVCDLVESILQDYFTGLLLLWELDKKKAEEDKWDPVWGVSKRNENPKIAILDGQQRLSALYYAFYNPEELFPNRNSYYSFTIDLNRILNDEYEDSVSYNYYRNYRSWTDLEGEADKWAETGIIPLSILSARDPKWGTKSYLKSGEFREWLNIYLENNKTKLPEDISSLDVPYKLTDILDYPFVCFTLSSDRDLHDICNIFARVNEKGMKLSTFDLINAFVYPKGVSLRKDLWDNLENDTLKNVDSSMNEYLLKIISLVKQEYCSGKYLFNLIPEKEVTKIDENGVKQDGVVLVKNADEFRSLWKNACKYAEKARKKLMNVGGLDFGAIKSSFIPNSPIIPVLGALLWMYDSEFKKTDTLEYLQKWYWSAIFSEHYGRSTDSVMSKDFREWKLWQANRIMADRLNEIDSDYINELDLRGVYKGSGIYNGILCLIALNNARDFYTSRPIGTGDYIGPSIDDHHIFPSKVEELDKTKCQHFLDLKDTILNRTLILDETDIAIRNKKPSDYLGIMLDGKKIGNEQSVKDILREHLISETAYNCLLDDDFDGFVNEREKTIKEHINKVLRNSA